MSVCSQNDVKLRFDGIYQTEQLNGSRTFLRFYERGTVLYVTSSGEIKDLIKWFHMDEHSRSTDVRGVFQLSNNNIELTLNSIEGKVVYKGSSENGLNIVFNTKSFINGNESDKEFNFVEF